MAFVSGVPGALRQPATCSCFCNASAAQRDAGETLARNRRQRQLSAAAGPANGATFHAATARREFHGAPLRPGRGMQHAHVTPEPGPSARAEAASHEDEVARLIKDGVITVLRDDERNVEYYVVGTAHVSANSVEHVRSAIRAVQPQAVMLELCPARGTSTLLLHPEDEKKLTQFNKKDVKKLAKKAGLMYVGLRYFYSIVSKRMGVVAGAEFMAAAEEATAVGAQIVLGDRPVDITLARLSRFAVRRLLPAFILLESAGLVFDQVQGAHSTAEVAQAAASSSGGIAPVVAALTAFFFTGTPFAPLSTTLGDTSDMSLRAAAFTADLLGVVASLPIMLGVSAAASVLLLSSNVVDKLIRVVQKTNLPAPGALVGERDQFLVWSMREHPLMPKRDARVVVVVGAAHVRGIARRFSSGHPIDLEGLVFDPRHDRGERDEVLERLRQKDEAAHEVIAQRQAQRAASTPPSPPAS